MGNPIDLFNNTKNNVTRLAGGKTNPEAEQFIIEENGEYNPNRESNNYSSNELAETAKNINDAGKNTSQLHTSAQTASKVKTDSYMDTGNLGKALDGWSAANNVVDAYKHYKNGDVKEAIVSGVKAGADLISPSSKLGAVAKWLLGVYPNDPKENSSDQDGKTSSIPKADPISGNILPWANDLFGFTTYDPLVINLDGSGIKTISYQDSQSIGVVIDVERTLQNCHLRHISGVCLARKFA